MTMTTRKNFIFHIKVSNLCVVFLHPLKNATSFSLCSRFSSLHLIARLQSWYWKKKIRKCSSVEYQTRYRCTWCRSQNIDTQNIKTCNLFYRHSHTNKEYGNWFFFLLLRFQSVPSLRTKWYTFVKVREIIFDFKENTLRIKRYSGWAEREKTRK